MEKDITDIEKLLKKVEKPSLSARKKQLLKENLMQQIETGQEAPMSRALARVAELVKGAASQVKLPLSEKVMMKENLFESMNKSRLNVFVSHFMVFGKRFTSGVAVASLLMGIVSFVTVDVNVALAESFTVIEEVSGDVSVLRDGEEVRVYEDMAILEGDQVTTGEDGFVSITFVDESVLRLSEDTGISVSRLFYDLRDRASSYIEIEVQKGSVWSRVLNLFGEDSVFVVKAGEFFTKAKKAAFSIKVDELETSVEVYHHVVDVETSSQGKTQVANGERVVSGQNAKPQIVSFEEEVEDEWVKQNLEDDKVYVAKVEEKKKEARQDVVDDSLKPFRSIKTGVQKFLTFDDISQQKLVFEEVQRGFVEAEVKLEGGKLSDDEARVVFEGFVAEVEALKLMISNVRANGDDEYADELKAYLNSELSQYKKDLASVLPESPLYVAKEVVLAAEVAAAEDEKESTQIKVDQTEVTLGEASDLAEAGREDLAQEALDDYAEDVESNTREAEAMEDDLDKEETLGKIKEAIEDGAGVVESLTEQPVVIVEVELGEEGLEDGEAVVDVENQKPLDPLLDLGR
jgi:hypothetical protein